MPVKVVPPVLLSNRQISSKQEIGPLVLMSGFMTKKTRSLNRWKQRWWQLLDNGFLFYFKNDDRVKILGQIDIARTCFDVRLGSDKCRVSFPRAAPSCCCISFAVLKRAYYVYTPTAGEAEKWYQSIFNMSRVINMKVIAGVEHRKAPEPPAPSRSPSCPPNYQVRITRVRTHLKGSGLSGSCEDITRIEYVRTDSRLSTSSKKAMAISVPDYLDKIGDDSLSIEDDVSLDSRLWLDGSPPAQTQSAQVHPHNSLSITDTSWTIPTRVTSSPTAVQMKCPTVVMRGRSSVESPREHHLSLPANVSFNFECREDQDEVEDKKTFSHHFESVADILCHSPSKGSQSLASSKELCLDTQPGNQPRPVPKPRRGKALAKLTATETCAAAQQNPVPSLRSSQLSSPPLPRRPRNNSEPSSILSQKKNSRNLPAYVHPRRGIGLRSHAKKRSPPSSPPPPPLPLRDVKPSLTPSHTCPPLRPRRDSGPPTFVPTLPRQQNYSDSGPPKFVPAPPPIEEMEASGTAFLTTRCM